ncbi:MAG TPA: TerB family tellurite resistance protein [Parvularculaceae bacterium]|nr:TerB family tellurite resistance protein [Parvularculaceae bacterium]
MDAAIAVTGAFLLVAFSDGLYAPSEERRFLSTIANDPALKMLSTGALEDAYNLLIAEIEADYDQACARILDCIRAVRGDRVLAAAVTLAARGATVADERIAPQEELALNRIAEALGLEKGSL